jgi:peptide/nickel transport system permease protein
MRRVLGFAIRRTAAAVFTVLAMVTLTFAIFWMIPGDPASFLYPNTQHVTKYEIKRADHLLGVDRPKYVQLGDYIWHLAQGDLGTAWTSIRVNADQKVVGLPVAPPLINAARVTGSIVLGGVLLVLLFSIPLGALAARFSRTALDRTILLVTLVGICLHPMVVGLIMRTFFGDDLHWLPPTGYCNFLHGSAAPVAPQNLGINAPTTCGGPIPWTEHLILPWISFALLFLAIYTRMIRTSVIETLRQDFVRTARAKGASENRVMVHHALPNAGIRVLTMVGLEIGTALGIAVYIESAFGMEGLGRLSVSILIGTLALDLPEILGVVVIVTLIVVVGNLIVDILYAVVDPRVSAFGTRPKETLSGRVV